MTRVHLSDSSSGVDVKELDTKDRLLAAGLEVFAERGYARATLAEITKRAEANIAAVNYHYRSKSDLFREIVDVFFAPVNAARMEAIHQCVARLDGEPDPLAAVIRSIVDPLVILNADPGRGHTMVRLMVRMRGPSMQAMYPVIVQAFDPIHEAAIDALARVCPDFSRAELVWRYDMARGAMLYTLSNTRQIERRLGTDPLSPRTPEQQVKVVRAFVLGAFSAPPVLLA